MSTQLKVICITISYLEWNSWTAGTTCSVSCGTGVQTDTRECIDHTNAEADPADCAPGTDPSRTVDCNTQECPGKPCQT